MSRPYKIFNVKKVISLAIFILLLRIFSIFTERNLSISIFVLILLIIITYLKTKNFLVNNLLTLEIISIIILIQRLLINLGPITSLIIVFFLITIRVRGACLGLSLLVILSRKNKLLTINKLF
jgi:hypothetical protein